MGDFLFNSIGSREPLFFPRPEQRAFLIEREWGGRVNFGCSECELTHLDRAVVEGHLPVHGTTDQGARP